MIEKSLERETFKIKCKINIIQAGLLLLWLSCSVCGLFVIKGANHVPVVSVILLLLFNHCHFVVWGNWYYIPQTYYALCQLLNNYFTHVNHIVLSWNKTQIKIILIIIVYTYLNTYYYTL